MIDPARLDDTYTASPIGDTESGDRTVTRQQAIDAHHGETFHHATQTNADGSPCRCRKNGACKVWKTRPDDFRLPVKHGLKNCFYITPGNASEWTLA